MAKLTIFPKLKNYEKLDNVSITNFGISMDFKLNVIILVFFRSGFETSEFVKLINLVKLEIKFTLHQNSEKSLHNLENYKCV